MNNIESVPGKLFYTVHQMYKESMIDARGKGVLKDLIILNNAQVVAAYEEYMSSGTELTLKNELFRIYKLERDAQKAEGLSDRSRKSRPKNPIINIKIPPKNIQNIPQAIRETK